MKFLGEELKDVEGKEEIIEKVKTVYRGDINDGIL